MHHSTSWWNMTISLVLFLAYNGCDRVQIYYGELIPLVQVYMANDISIRCHIKNLLIPGCVCVEVEGGCIHIYTKKQQQHQPIFNSRL